jgi:hypothetical protein
VFLPIKPVKGVGGFVMSLLGTAKDWQDTLAAGMPGPRERIIRVSLTSEEGGLNLDMAPETSRTLMDCGTQAGQALLKDFSFSEHAWRRALVANEQLEEVAHAANHAWTHGADARFRSSATMATSYGAVTQPERQLIETRLGAFAAMGAGLTPKLSDKPGKLPRPKARMRIAPDI